MKVYPSAFYLSDYDFGQAIANDVLARHPQTPSTLLLQATTRGNTLIINAEWALKNEEDAVLARAANILTRRGNEREFGTFTQS